MMAYSITFEWDALMDDEANGIIRWYKITCVKATDDTYYMVRSHLMQSSYLFAVHV